ncbi:RNA polymerase subunit sigma [Bacillus rhizoplanae]|uniref:RNA polymerase subunit sigma n=1 Tax=Bacillus rhizoplanae TaxID=2880966 RepID=UPI003D21D25F
MTVDYENPRLDDYKKLIRFEAELSGNIRLATIFGESSKVRELKLNKKLIAIRIRIIEASFILKHKKTKSTALQSDRSMIFKY